MTTKRYVRSWEGLFSFLFGSTVPQEEPILLDEQQQREENDADEWFRQQCRLEEELHEDGEVIQAKAGISDCGVD